MLDFGIKGEQLEVLSTLRTIMDSPLRMLPYTQGLDQLRQSLLVECQRHLEHKVAEFEAMAEAAAYSVEDGEGAIDKILVAIVRASLRGPLVLLTGFFPGYRKL